MKKIMAAAALLAVIAAAAFLLAGRNGGEKEKTSIKVGISIYREDDTFISGQQLGSRTGETK